MPKILCVEDEEDLRQDIVEELEDAGYEVIEASNGQEALDMILNQGPDMVVSDITMPVMDGYQLVKTLREDHPKFAEMPFIFLSALADREHILEGMSAGSDDYLTKPIDFEMLLVKVETRLRQAERMLNKKQEEQVLLFKAMQKKLAPKTAKQAPAPDSNMPRIALVGSKCEAQSEFRAIVEAERYNIRMFTSGRSYLRKVKNLKPNITCFSVRTDDFDISEMLARHGKEMGECFLIVPENGVKNLRFMLKGDNRQKLNSIIVIPSETAEILEALTKTKKQKQEEEGQETEEQEEEGQEAQESQEQEAQEQEAEALETEEPKAEEQEQEREVSA